MPKFSPELEEANDSYTQTGGGVERENRSAVEEPAGKVKRGYHNAFFTNNRAIRRKKDDEREKSGASQ